MKESRMGLKRKKAEPVTPPTAQEVREHSYTEQEALYEQDGLTLEYVREKATLLKDWHLPERRESRYDFFNPISLVDFQTSTPEEIADAFLREHENVFYTSSSDAIEYLELAHVQGERLVTVAASGDATLALLRQSPASIEMCDVSVPGIFFNELKLLALRTLNYEDFQKMFYTRWTRPSFDIDLYQQLQSQLSVQARTFFDELLGAPTYDSDAAMRPSPSFARSRAKSIIGDVVKTEDEYQKLQKQAQQTRIILRRISIEQELQNKNVDVVYLSNVGYEPEVTGKIAKAFLKRGTKRVIAALDLTRKGYRVDGEGEEEVLHINAVSGRILGHSYDVDFGLMVEFDAVE